MHSLTRGCITSKSSAILPIPTHLCLLIAIQKNESHSFVSAENNGSQIPNLQTDCGGRGEECNVYTKRVDSKEDILLALALGKDEWVVSNGSAGMIV